MSNLSNPVIAEQLSEAERELTLELSCSLRTMRYLNIGCQPCTALPSDPNSPRSGRWGETKLEYEIHTFTKRAER